MFETAWNLYFLSAQEAAMKLSTLPGSASSLEMYLSEINQFPLLTVEEQALFAAAMAGTNPCPAAIA